MPNDPGLANDTCIFIEAVTGDNGTHTTKGVWWLSPDIELTGPVSGADTADAGQVNPVQVRFHRKSASSNCQFPGDESVTVQLWVGNPSLLMVPGVKGSTRRVGFIGSPLPAEGDTGVQQIDWTPPVGLSANDPQSAGQKCLVARCYPESGSPNAQNFFLPGDQHVAQHNLCLISTTAKQITFTVNTVNPAVSLNPLLPTEVTEVKLRAILDLFPNSFIRQTVLQRLQSVNGFQRLRKAALPGGFAFDLGGLQAFQITNHSIEGVTPPFHTTLPFFEARVALRTRVVVKLTFDASLQGVSAGDACIFHLLQSNISDVPQGGLTLVVLKL
jgi:hypothetical protein